jgi:hypothetical protein
MQVFNLRYWGCFYSILVAAVMVCAVGGNIMCGKYTSRRAGEPCAKRCPPDLIVDDQQTNHFEFLTSVAKNANKGCGKRKQSSQKSAIGIFIGIVLSGVVGLAIGYFVLHFLFPKHPFVREMANIFNSTGQDCLQKSPVSQVVGKSPKPQNLESPLPSLQPPGRQDDEQLPKPSQPPTGLDHGSPPIPSTSKNRQNENNSQHKVVDDEVAISPIPQQNENDFQPLPGFGKNQNEQTTVNTPPLKEIRHVITLNLSKTISQATFGEASTGDEVIRIEDVTDLGTPWEIKPNDGAIRNGHPVHVVLKDYPNVDIIIRLSLPRNIIVVQAAPQVDTGKSNKTPLTLQWVKQSLLNLNKDLDKANQTLSEAKNASNTIEAWLNAPGSKPPNLKEAKQQQLSVMKSQLIPEFERQASAAQKSVDAMQRLSALVEQVHDKATIHLLMRMGTKDTEEIKSDIADGDHSRMPIELRYNYSDENLRRDITAVCNNIVQIVEKRVGKPPPMGTKPIIIQKAADGVPRALVNGLPREYIINVTCLDSPDYSRLTYQLGHELGHIYVDPTKDNWFIESMAATVSIAALSDMGDKWTNDPPFTNWKPWAHNFYDYRQRSTDGMLESIKLKSDEISLKRWLRSRTTKNLEARPEQYACALIITSVLSKYPQSFGAITSLGAATSSNGYTDFRSWQSLVAPGERAFVTELANLFDSLENR